MNKLSLTAGQRVGYYTSGRTRIATVLDTNAKSPSGFKGIRIQFEADQYADTGEPFLVSTARNLIPEDVALARIAKEARDVALRARAEQAEADYLARLEASTGLMLKGALEVRIRFDANQITGYQLRLAPDQMEHLVSYVEGLRPRVGGAYDALIEREKTRDNSHLPPATGN